jgi:hypothetical protein
MASIKGVWTFNENVSTPLFDDPLFAKFTSNGNEYSYLYAPSGLILYKPVDGTNDIVVTEHDGSWVDDAYRTADFGETEQAINYEYYIWILANAVPENIVESSATVKGVWTFVDNPTIDDIAQPVEFVSNGTTYYGIDASASISTVDDRINFIPYAGVPAYQPSTTTAYFDGYWHVNAYRIVDFGETEQSVSTEFYEWLTSNATQAQLEPERPYIKGVWTFNEKLTDPKEETFSLKFTVGGETYHYMRGELFGPGGSGYALLYVQTNADGDWINSVTVYDSFDGWRNKKYRRIDLGENEQLLIDYKYDWFVSNAIAEQSSVYVIQKATLVGIAEAIRAKAGTEVDYTPLEMPSGINAVYEAGKAAGGNDGSYNEGYTDGESAGYEKGHREGYDSGYEDGYEEGLQEGLKLGDSNGSYVDGYNNGYAEGYIEGEMNGYEEGMVDGQQNEYDTFWDTYQSNGTRANYMRAFAESYWKDAIFKPKYPITCKATQSYHTSNALSVFQSSDITHIDVPITIDGSAIGGVVADSFFSGADQLETIFSFTPIAVTRYTQTFLTCKKLKNITIGDGGSIDVNISFSDSPLLTNESVQSIIDHLKDLRDATTQKLTLHANVGAAVTNAQKAAITAKNWTLVY